MGSIASELKSERQKRKISLAQIAAETRISLRYLESLEEGRYGDLPGGMYNRAFMKAYCEFLNLDFPEIMQRYEAELSPALEKPPRTKVHIPQQNSSFRVSPVVIWGVMLLITGTGLFFSRKWITAIFSPYFSHVPVAEVRYQPVQPVSAVPKTKDTAPPAAASSASTSGSPETIAPEPAGPLPVPSKESTIAAGSMPIDPGTAQSAPVPSNMPVVSDKALRLEIKASEKCWISVNRDGSPVVRKVMEPGEIQTFNATEKLEIILGNAGGVHLMLNGKPAKQLGKPGEVVKVLIDEKSLQDIQDQTAG
jgi:cytoskeleton protein RodZ